MKRRIAILGLLCFLLLVPFSELRADTVTVGYPTTPGTAFYAVLDAGFPGAAEFTLLGGTNVTSIDVTLISVAATTADLSLQSALTGSPTIFDSAVFALAAPVSPNSFLIQTFSLTVNSLLAPGTYFLELSGSANEGGWMVSDGTLVSNGGTAPNGAWLFSTFDQNGNPLNTPAWVFFQDSTGICSPSSPCNSPTYAVNVAATPEPGTVLLLASGLVAGALKMRRAVAKRYRGESLVTGIEA